MKVALLDKIHPILTATFKLAGWEIIDISLKSDEEAIELIPQFDGLIIRSRFKLTQEILSKTNRLKFIGRPGAGLENIDTTCCKQQNIAVFRSPEGNRDAVAEHAIGSLVSLLRYIPKSNKEVKNGIWDRINNRGEEIMGKTIGLIGYGYMGKAFAKRLSGFGAHVITYDKYLTNYGDDYAKQVSLEELKNKADILSLHTPLTDETKGLVNEKFINEFEKNIYLLNTARGQSVVLKDLVRLLKAGKVKGASLDVLEIEKTSFEDIFKDNVSKELAFLSKQENVILTPHVAGWTHQSNEKMACFLAKKIVKHFT